MFRKKNRLAKENYKPSKAYYLTLCCKNRNKYFIDVDLISICIEKLRIINNRFQGKVWVYCFMPDHVHIVIETENCANFIQLFKQLTGYVFKQQTTKNLWQKSFYDHILRSQEDLRDVMAYVLNNPVRARIVKHYLDYPHSGSFEIRLKDFMES